MKYLFTIFSLLTILTACQNQTESTARTTTQFSGNAMTIDYKVIVGDPLNYQQYLEVSDHIAATFEKVNNIYNNWNPASEISQLNILTANTEIKISPELFHFLERTQEIVELTGGLFDPTVEPIHSLWKERMGIGQIPSEDDIAAIAPAIGWKNIHLKDGVFSKDHSNTRMDLGGIAKGLCVDILIESLNDLGYMNVFAEWGGEIRASGKHPEGRPWNIFISNLGDSDPKNAIAHIDISDQAIAASGDYWQYWVIPTGEDEGSESKVYTHIVNPLTMHAIIASNNSIASTNVVAKDCTLADALATAAMLFPNVKEAQAWSKNVKEKIPEAEFWFILRDDK
jgi:FAD:protein FMN transferase